MTDDEKRERVALAMACPHRNGVDQEDRWSSMSAERRNVWLIRAGRAIDALEGTLPEDEWEYGVSVNGDEPYAAYPFLETGLEFQKTYWRTPGATSVNVVRRTPRRKAGPWEVVPDV